MPTPPADDRLRRLLALVPWIAERDGVEVCEVSARFDYPERELVEDLRMLFMCGLHPYTPDTLIDVDIAEGRVWIRYADYFSRPLRLTPTEALSLVAAGQALLADQHSDPDGPLARGLRKLSAAVGTDMEAAVDVALDPAPPEVLATLREARSASQAVRIDYYSFGRDQWSERVVEPYDLFNAAGQWYLSAYCRKAGDDRLFRVDRIRSARAMAEEVDRRASQAARAVFNPSPDDPRVCIEVGEQGRWVAEQYPVESVEETASGRWRITLVAGQRAWLERLLLRLGPDALLVPGAGAGVGDEVDDPAPAAAARILRRYAAASGGTPASLLR